MVNAANMAGAAMHIAVVRFFVMIISMDIFCPVMRTMVRITMTVMTLSVSAGRCQHHEQYDYDLFHNESSFFLALATITPKNA